MHLAHQPSGTRFLALPGVALVALALLASLAGRVSAQAWSEVGDAGQLPASAQNTTGLGPLTTITGTFQTPVDVDMYCIQVTDPASFGAFLLCFIIQSPDLYLFDSTGKGIAVAQICSGSSKTIAAPFVTSAGTYYLAVAPFGSLALSGAGPIWNPGTTLARAPDGPGAAGPIVAWGGTPIPPNPTNYQITLFGVGYCSAATPVRVRSWGTLKSYYH